MILEKLKLKTKKMCLEVARPYVLYLIIIITYIKNVKQFVKSIKKKIFAYLLFINSTPSSIWPAL